MSSKQSPVGRGVGFAIARDILESGRTIDNYRVNPIASLAGAPMDKGAGVDLLKKLGDRVAAGEHLYRLHAQSTSHAP